MRLLSFHSEGLSHKVFTGTVPSYATPSNVWDKEKFTYNDLVSQTGKSKSDYRKIEFCARQVAQDQLQYF